MNFTEMKIFIVPSLGCQHSSGPRNWEHRSRDVGQKRKVVSKWTGGIKNRQKKEVPK